MTTTGRQRTDPIGRPESAQITLTGNSTAERDAARDHITRRATSVHDQYQLMRALGLDHADEIHAQAGQP